MPFCLPSLAGPYLLLVTNSVRVGSLHGGHVFLVTETKLLQASKSALTPAQVQSHNIHIVVYACYCLLFIRFVAKPACLRCFERGK